MCKQCHALVHAEELERLATDARMLEDQGEPSRAREQWLKALERLPAESRQASWIKAHSQRLELAASISSAPPTQSKPLGRFAPLAPIVVALTKGKALLALFNLKFLLSLGAFVGVYWSVYGMKFGIGFAAQILVHELGHFIDIKRRGMPADMPVFLPGFGAYVRWKAMGVPLATRAAVSLAGPLAGWLGAAFCTVIWLKSGNDLWAALARAGAWLNLLNLIPVWALDGGHACLALTKSHRGLLLAASLLFFLLVGDGMFLLIALGATWRLFTKDLPEQPSLSIATYFVAVLSALAGLMWILPGQGFGRP